MKENKYEKISYIIYGIAATVIIMLVTGISIQSYRLGRYRKQCEQYRIELERAEDNQRGLTETITDCYGAITDCYGRTVRTAEILSQSTSSISELREQLRFVKENYEYMEDRLRSVIGSTYYSNNSEDELND